MGARLPRLAKGEGRRTKRSRGRHLFERDDVTGFLPKHLHQAAERAARVELVRMGFKVEPDPSGDGVVIVGSGWQVRARTARRALADMR